MGGREDEVGKEDVGATFVDLVDLLVLAKNFQGSTIYTRNLHMAVCTGSQVAKSNYVDLEWVEYDVVRFRARPWMDNYGGVHAREIVYIRTVFKR